MNFTELTKYFVLVVMVACLVVGYILKTAFPKVPNNKIPVILAALGASAWSICHSCFCPGFSMNLVNA